MAMILLKAKVLYQDRSFVDHSVDQHVDVITYVKQNWTKLFWAMLKCAHKGVLHRWNRQHLHQHAPEGRHNISKKRQ